MGEETFFKRNFSWTGGDVVAHPSKQLKTNLSRTYEKLYVNKNRISRAVSEIHRNRQTHTHTLILLLLFKDDNLANIRLSSVFQFLYSRLTFALLASRNSIFKGEGRQKNSLKPSQYLNLENKYESAIK